MSFKSLVLVLLQFFLIGFIVIKGTVIFLDALILLQLAGISIAIWGTLSIGSSNFNIQPEVKSDALVKNGIYQWIRNPMYLGILLFFIPTVSYSKSVFIWIAYFLLMIVLLLKIVMEEHFLEQKFGEVYLRYKKDSFRLIPYIF